MKSKVLVGFQNGIGNWVMMTPAIQAISWYYDSKVDLLVHNNWQGEIASAVLDMAKNAPFIGKIIPWKRSDIVGGYQCRYMSYHNVKGELFHQFHLPVENKKLPHWGKLLIHETEWYMWELKQQIGISLKPPRQSVFVGGSIKGLPNKYICLSNGYLRTPEKFYDRKAWPLENWIALEKAIKNFFGIETIILGGKDDMEWGSFLSGLNMAGKLDIGSTASVLKNSLGLVSTDTSVMHIADALYIPGVALFGPTMIAKNGPVNGTIVPLRSDKNNVCSPCQGTVNFNKCSGSPCMENITVGHVMAILRRFL